MKAKKFIIVDGKFIYGEVEEHQELLPEKYIKISGGGRYVIYPEKK